MSGEKGDEKIWRLAIIGGGPAGSFFAHFAYRWAWRLGKQISITIFDGKSFQESGPRGCNLCAGVVSRSLQRLLEEEGILLPVRRIMSWVGGYILHVQEESLRLTSPEGRPGKVATVFRGNGPRYARFPEVISFDDFLLSWAQDLGAKVIPYPVQTITWPDKPEQPIGVKYGPRGALAGEEEADILIGAFGVNTTLGRKIQELGLGYVPPPTRLTYQAELKFPPELRKELVGEEIHVFIPRKSSIRYATLIPKGEYTTLTIISHRDVEPGILEEFFRLEGIRGRLPPLSPTCFCYPRIAIAPCRLPKSSRFLMVGDAAFCRYYKNGLESAFLTARGAAEAIFVEENRERVRHYYFQSIGRKIIRDNLYGRLLFRLNDFIASLAPLTRFHLALMRQPREKFLSRRLHTILWDMFTGEIPYRQIFWDCFHPRLQLGLLKAFLSTDWRREGRQRMVRNQEKLLATTPDRSVFDYEGHRKNYGPIRNTPLSLDGKTIAVIGGGPAGTSFAIKLSRLARERGERPRIVLYEGKPLEKKSHYNQCLGVLSPPLPDIMEQELGIPFPWPIIQKTILGYYLHTERTTLRLDGSHEPSFACRRVEFDSYLFQKAREEGVEIINARVMDLDLLHNGVMVYSESDNLRADLVVGAFGLDDGMAKVFERLTSYRQPDFLSSIVTKFHPGQEAMEAFGQYLHAFLLRSLPRVEFAAITPKGNHLSLNIAGRNVEASHLDLFLRLPVVRRVLPETIETALPTLAYHKGKFPTGPARNFIMLPIIMIGDAAGLNRPFKGKGINSAILTGIRAAKSLVEKGISPEMEREFRRKCVDLSTDIPYGRGLRLLTIIFTRLGLMDGILEAARTEAGLRRVLFHIVSGQKAYRTIWEEEKNLRLFLRVARNIIGSRGFDLIISKK